MSRRLCAALALISAVAGVAVLAGPRPVRVIGGILLALLLPGLALTTALFRDRISLTAIEKCMLVPALSLATLVLGGLSAWGLGLALHRTAWLAVSELVTLIALATAIVWPVPQPEPQRRRGSRYVKLPTPRDPTLILPVFLDRELGFQAEPRWWRKLIPARPGLSLVPLLVAVALLTGSGWYSVHESHAFHEVRVTSLSAAPPSAANALGERSVAVTAAGLPAYSRAYALMVAVDGGVSTRQRTVVADAKGRWTGTVVVEGGERTTIELLATGAAAPTRTVIIAAG